MSGNCVLFVGSGLSLTAGYPTWDKLILTMFERCGIEVESIASLSVDDKLVKLDEARESDPVAYEATLQSLFGRPASVIPRTYIYLAKLPFSSYITVNYDPLLATACLNEKEDRNVLRYPNLRPQEVNEESIQHLHGFIGEDGDVDLNDLVLGRRSFQEAYEGHRGHSLQALLQTAFVHYPILFVGCGLSEPPIRFLFQWLRGFISEIEQKSGESGPTHYILRNTILKRENQKRDRESEKVKEKDFESMGITTVWYDKDDEEHSSLIRIFEDLVGLDELTPRIGFAFND